MTRSLSEQPTNGISSLGSEGMPLFFSRISQARPSRVYDTYWKFAAERQEVFFRRFEGVTGTLTRDPIINKHKFTNAYRASDRVSQYLIRWVIYEGDQSAQEIFFRTLLFKFFNKIDTWHLLRDQLGEVCWRSYSFRRYDAILTEALSNGQRIYSAAYIMPTARGIGDQTRKHRTHLKLLERMIHEGTPERIAASRTMREAFEILKQYPMMGNFLAYQFVTDLNYSVLTNFSEMEFIVPGPGARDGLRKCFEDYGDLSESDLIKLMADRQEMDFDRLGLSFRSLWGRTLQLIDCQNLFCETDKYARLAHPEVQGLSGRTRIKQVYRPTAESIDYWYPPKWGLNNAVASDRARHVSALEKCGDISR
ncbi:MAG: nucleotide kinase domain-containing protein [Vicinamibacterales bacterium]